MKSNVVSLDGLCVEINVSQKSRGGTSRIITGGNKDIVSRSERGFHIWVKPENHVNHNILISIISSKITEITEKKPIVMPITSVSGLINFDIVLYNIDYPITEEIILSNIINIIKENNIFGKNKIIKVNNQKKQISNKNFELKSHYDSDYLNQNKHKLKFTKKLIKITLLIFFISFLLYTLLLQFEDQLNNNPIINNIINTITNLCNSNI